MRSVMLACDRCGDAAQALVPVFCNEVQVAEVCAGCSGAQPFFRRSGHTKFARKLGRGEVMRALEAIVADQGTASTKDLASRLGIDNIHASRVIAKAARTLGYENRGPGMWGKPAERG